MSDFEDSKIALPEGLSESQIPTGWERTMDGEQTRGYVNGEQKLYVYVYVDSQMERAFGVNLERQPDHPGRDDEPQVAATTVKETGTNGSAEPSASLLALVKGYMELAVELDGD